MSDYTDHLLAKTKPEYMKTPERKFGWWEVAPTDEDFDEEYIERQRSSSLLNCARELDSAQREVHEQNLWSAQLYSNRELAAFDWGSGQLVKASLAPVSRTGENLASRVVDSLVSQIGKNRPKPKPQARGASFHLRQDIKKLDKFLYGEWQRNKVYTLTKRAFRDSCIFPFGCVKVEVVEEDGSDRVRYERVFPDEILVDQMEIVASGKIRHFYRRRVLPIEVVAATYNLDEDQIERLQDDATFTYLDYRPIGRGWTVVVEGYQLASNGCPGRWMVAGNNVVFEEGTWEHEWLPYVFYHYNDPVSGFYPPSVVEQVLPYQIRLNEINEVIRDAQDLMARPRILVAKGSQVNPLEIDNVIGRFIQYTGIAPEAITWPAISAELYNERDRLVSTCLEQLGISNMAATATPPPAARFDSSPAFREFNAIQDDRLSDPAQRYEGFHLELAERTVQVICASGKNPKTVWYSGWKHSKAEEIEWKDLNLEENSFVMTMEAVSIFTMSPASARDELEKQLGMGLITPEQYRMELSDMDSESAYTLQAAAAQDLNRVQELLETGGFENPIPQQDLASGVIQMNLALLNLRKYDDVDPQVELNFINWITLAEAIMKQGTDSSETIVDDGPVNGPAPIDPMTGMPIAGPMAGPQGGMAGMPGTVPVPEAMGLAPAGPGPMPGI